MSRKKFIESYGATCANWTWSWSFINEKKKFIIFGEWENNAEGSLSLIFSKDWMISGKGKKLPAYDKSREHIRLIEEEGYGLKTFKMKFSDEYQDEAGVGPAKIKGFERALIDKSLVKIGNSWYASDNKQFKGLPEEIDR